jgi:exosortase E/protease (VPEID-CTERM system)
MMAIILAIECVPVTTMQHPWLRAKAFTASTIFFCAALLFFGRAKLQSLEWREEPVDRRFAILHVCALGLFFAANIYLLLVAKQGTGLARAVLCVWYGALALVPITVACALFSLRRLWLMFVSLGSAWGYAAVCGLLTLSARTLLLEAWDAPASQFGQAMQGLTFRGVHALLSLFYPVLISDQQSAVLGTERFMVHIAGKCSGIEGLALMLGLTVGWLVFSRRELRLRRALLLVPVSLALIFLLNMTRIAALVALGDAGFGAVAVDGFHSEAGWILFSTVSLGFLLLVNRVAWFQQAGSGGQNGLTGAVPIAGGAERESNLAAVYLLPFLAILASSLLSQAASAGFEWLYPLRVLAVLGVVYAYRREYREMDWRFGWLGPAAGVAIFAFWVASVRWFGTGTAGGEMAAGLARLSGGQRAAWIAARIVGGVVAIPFAEELAFRGFLARRLMSVDVESVNLRSLSVLAVLGSSLAFALMHGRMWLAGMLAGVVFCVVAKLRGRLGEAVAAHATANLMIAIWVLARGDYSLW